MTDREIVNGYLQGEKKHYTTVVRWMEEVVKNHVWLAAISPEDVVSEVTEKLLTNFRRNKFGFESSVKTYVQRVTRYTIIDLARSYKRAERLMASENLDVNEVETPQQIYEDKEEAFLFGRIFSMINDKCQKLWRMIFTDEMTYGEIASRLGKTESAIKAQVFRCKDEAVAIHKRLT